MDKQHVLLKRELNACVDQLAERTAVWYNAAERKMTRAENGETAKIGQLLRSSVDEGHFSNSAAEILAAMFSVVIGSEIRMPTEKDAIFPPGLFFAFDGDGVSMTTGDHDCAQDYFDEEDFHRWGSMLLEVDGQSAEVVDLDDIRPATAEEIRGFLADLDLVEFKSLMWAVCELSDKMAEPPSQKQPQKQSQKQFGTIDLREPFQF